MMPLKDDILYELSLNEFVSGEKLAEKYYVSRNSIWKAIRKLREEGYEIEAVTNKGYKLCVAVDKISEIAIKPNLNNSWNFIILDKVDSTNTYANKLIISGIKENSVVIAEEQIGGKGRFNRNFYSPKGNGLYMSILFKPKIKIENSPLITSYIAVAVSKAIEKLCTKDVNIKWVNDIYMNGKKICGILTEAGFDFDCGTLDYAIIGIGINVFGNDFPEDIKNIASSIEKESGLRISRNELIVEILNNISDIESDIESRKYLDIYRKKSNVIGKNINVYYGKEEFEALAVEIDNNAALVVKTNNGIKVLNSGEVSIKL